MPIRSKHTLIDVALANFNWLQGAETHHVAVIASNPEQSKHLETARMKIRGHWIDLVNLRSEEYAQNSRIPSMKFGTPEQDALRRDFTINALFYNINSRSVEDFTGRGLTDLCKGIIRTPLAPKETFLDGKNSIIHLELRKISTKQPNLMGVKAAYLTISNCCTDPLRVLRAVRFSARFGFTLEESLLLAASDDDVREALGHKVSRERIGAELDGMLKGPNPVGAVRLLRTLRLFEAVFEVHPSANSDVVEEFASVGTALLTAVYDVMHHAEWAKDNQDCSPEAKRLTLLAALLLPLRKAKVNSGVKGKPQSMATHIIKDSLKWRGKDSENVDTLHAVAPRLLTILGLLTRGDESLETAATGPDANKEEVQRQIRVQLGQCLRVLKKELWLPGIVIASVLPMIECDQHSHLEVDAQTSGLVRVMHENEDDGSIDKLATIPMPNLFTPAQMGVTSKTLEAQVDACSVLIKASRDFELVGCWDWKPLLDGKAVMAAVGMAKGGPALGHVMEQVMGWQLANPRASREDCKIWLKEHGADILQNFEESILKPK